MLERIKGKNRFYRTYLLKLSSDLFDRVYCIVPNRFRLDKFDKILDTRAKITDDFFFIQIGSNDGILHDQIHNYVMKYNWSGVLIEPVKYIFNSLVKNYENKKI